MCPIFLGDASVMVSVQDRPLIRRGIVFVARKSSHPAYAGVTQVLAQLWRLSYADIRRNTIFATEEDCALTATYSRHDIQSLFMTLNDS